MEPIIIGIVCAIIVLFDKKRGFASCRPRACLNFTANKEIWGDVEIWAKREGYKLNSHSGAERVYRKNVFFWSNASCLLIRQDREKVHIEAWVKMNFLVSNIEVAIDEATILSTKKAIRLNKLLEILGSQVKFREAYKTRTRLVDFVSDKNIWQDVEHWAKEEGYKLNSQSDKERVYKKGFFLHDPDFFPYITVAYLLICQDVNNKVHVEAWVKAGIGQEIAADEEDLLRKKRWKDNAVRVNRLLAILESPATLKEA